MATNGAFQRPPMGSLSWPPSAACAQAGCASATICPTSEENVSRESPAQPRAFAPPSPPKGEETRMSWQHAIRAGSCDCSQL